MESMEELMKKLGWIAWCLTVIGWFLSPIINLLVNKLFPYVVFDASKKLKELKDETIRELKKKLTDVEEQTLLIAAKDPGSQCDDLNRLDIMKMDLKSALYEAEDILDLLEYRRIEKGLHHGDDDSVWVENQLAAACAWIARCKGSCFGRWMHVTVAAVIKGAQSLTQLWQKFDLACVCRAINIAATAVLQCAQCCYQPLSAQSWYPQLGQLFRSVPLLPVSINPTGQPPSLQPSGSEFVLAGPARPAEEMEEEIVEEPQVEDGEGDEIQDGEESSEGGEGEETSGEIEEKRSLRTIFRQPSWSILGETSEEIEEERSSWTSILGETSEQEREDNKEGKEGESTSVSLLRRCAGSMLTWYAKACFHRDWSYGIVGINSDKKDASAVESLVPITERISLFKQIKRIEGILNTSKKLDLLNHKNSSSSSTKDTDKNSSNGTAQNADTESSSLTAKNRAKESSSKQKEIDELYRSIQKKVFGRDKERAHISRMLREAPDSYASSTSTIEPYSVIGIYGITGSGKSTLAQYVCDFEKSTEAGRHFDPVMFILVGKTFRVGDIFRDMLEQITQSRPANDEGLKSLKTKLEEKLKDKRFLLVLDDLWVNDDDQKELDILLHMLSTAQRGSRVLVTSQKKDAAQALGAQEQISIPDMEEGVYLSLFMHHARPDDEEYERTGTKIANKLCRSPIAAVTVGKRLQRNKSKSFWETAANLDVLNTTMGALWWCYQQLGVDIRRCFAYCSTFPRGYELKQDELVHIWIAQGFVNKRSDKEEEMEDIGQSYLNQLVTFSFLEAEGNNFFMIFRIHDLLHELAERVSGSEFLRIGSDDSPEHIPQGVRHLFIETTYAVKIAKKLVEVENLRTLIIKEAYLAPFSENLDSRLLERLFTRLTKLRVLIIEQGGFAEVLSVPACIDRMKHLRYLGLRFPSGLSVMSLPSTFSKLYHIETIDFPVGTELRCPEDMTNLTNLRHISDQQNFPNIGRLTSLRTMRWFRVKEEQGYGLKQLKHLNKLGGNLIIDGLGVVRSKEEALEAHLTHKKRLRELELIFGPEVCFGRDVKAEVLEGLCPPGEWFGPDVEAEVLEGLCPPDEWFGPDVEAEVLEGLCPPDEWFGPDVEAEVLEGLCPPEDLRKLSIKNYTASRYPSWMLSTPEQLYRLELCSCSQLASIPKGSKLFIGLRRLCITSCDWDSLPENMERLASLQKLEIWFCGKMKLLEITLSQALKKIDIRHCNKLRSIKFICGKEERLEARTSLEYCQHTAPTGTPEQPLYPMMPRHWNTNKGPCLVNLKIGFCPIMETLRYLPPSLKKLSIENCGEIRYVSGQLGQLEELYIFDCNKLLSVNSLGDASSLKTLSLYRCQRLASLGSCGGPGSYLALGVFRIKDCPNMDMKQFNEDVLDRLLRNEI